MSFYSINRRTMLTGMAAAGLSAPFVKRSFGQSNAIVIGHQADLTGGLSSWGAWMDKAARAAVEYCNANGGIAGRHVEYAVEDSASNPAEGARKFRALVDREGANFIIGATHSGVDLASAPIAQEMRVPYFPAGMAEEKTGVKGNRYIFQLGSDTYMQAAAGTEAAYHEYGNEWTFIFSDYAWGWSHFNEQTRILKELGAKINDPIAVPLDAKDYLPYLTQIPSSTNVIFPLAFGSGAIAMFSQLKSMKLDENAQVYGVICTHEAISPKDVGGATEGFQMLEYHPRSLEFHDTEFNRAFFKTLGVEADGAREIGGNRIAAMSHAWSAWESVFAIKKAVEESGWANGDDTPKFIEALEGMSFEESFEHPQGSKTMRPQDHKAISDNYVSKIENGRFVVKSKVSAADIASRMPPKVDFTKEAF
ncbi:MAG: ABC transporter substrate-binding protein [Rhodobacteraceae bacterium]|nr:ABC transporter substrate-binding protein [Paracoccaceae bacterium]